jgi:hypothetical protein
MGAVALFGHWSTFCSTTRKGHTAGRACQARRAGVASPGQRGPVRFSISTIERCYRRAINERQDPVGVLQRKVRTDLGQQTSMTDAVRQALFA